MNQQIAVVVVIFLIIFLISLIIKFFCYDENTIVEDISIHSDSIDQEALDIETNWRDINHEALDIETNWFDINQSSQVINYFFVSANQPEIECPICLEPINNCHVTQFICLHKYHQNCINEWINKRSNDVICPECGI